MDFETWLLLGIFSILLAIAIRLDGIYKILLKKRGPIYECNSNIFSNSNKPYAIGYFNNKWTRFKHISILIKPQQTIYSFRHTGAINVYEKSKSIFVLQKALDQKRSKFLCCPNRGC